MKKKKLLILISIGVFLALAIFILGQLGFYGLGSVNSVNEKYPKGSVELPIPGILDDLNSDPNKAEFYITAQNGTHQFFDGVETSTLGYNGSFLGPVIKVRTGEEVTIHVENQLDKETTVHWHGLKVDGAMDGGVHSHIHPGSKWIANFTINQPATTLWYHPHQMGETAIQVYNGLVGLFLIEDEISDELNIPKDYGYNDIPLIIQDKDFDKNGQLDYQLTIRDYNMGKIGDTIIVNGAINPYVEVPKGLVRFRILNGSNGGIYDLELSTKTEFYQIASDGGFLEKPVKLNKLRLGPAERAEILVDFSKLSNEEKIELMNNGSSFMQFFIKDDEVLSAKHFEVPKQLTEIERLKESDAIQTREFIFGGYGKFVNINHKKMDMDRIDEVVSLNTIEVWNINNWTGTLHPFHAHGVQFQILEREGKAPPENESGWEDTFLVGPGEDVKVIAKFENKGLFMYHCHILEHEDAGMMGQFLVE